MNIQQYEAKGKKKYKVEGAYIGVDVMTGKQIRTTITGNSKADVKRKLENKKREFERDGSTTRKKGVIKTVDQLIDLWLETEYKGSVKPNTEKSALVMIKRKVRPFVGYLRLDRLTTAIVQEAMNEYSKSPEFQIELPWRPWTYLNRVFMFGVRMEYLKKNYYSDTLRVKTETGKPVDEIKYYTSEQVDTILNGLQELGTVRYKESMFACFVRLQIFTGLRAGEALALNWDDIDFDNGTLSVSKTLVSDTQTVQSPKTRSSKRTIQLADETIKDLQVWKSSQTQKCWNLGLTPPKTVFWNVYTKGYCSYRIMLRELKEFVENLGLPYLKGVHSLRHTYATLHLASGTPYHIIQKNLGHADVSMTMKVYAHTQGEEIKEANNKVINLFSKTGT